MHVEEHVTWSADLELARRRFVASCQRGMGPPRQSEPLNNEVIVALDMSTDPIVDNGPVNTHGVMVLCPRKRVQHVLRNLYSTRRWCRPSQQITIISHGEDDKPLHRVVIPRVFISCLRSAPSGGFGVIQSALLAKYFLTPSVAKFLALFL